MSINQLVACVVSRMLCINICSRMLCLSFAFCFIYVTCCVHIIKQSESDMVVLYSSTFSLVVSEYDLS